MAHHRHRSQYSIIALGAGSVKGGTNVFESSRSDVAVVSIVFSLLPAATDWPWLAGADCAGADDPEAAIVDEEGGSQSVQTSAAESSAMSDGAWCRPERLEVYRGCSGSDGRENEAGTLSCAGGSSGVGG